MNTRMDRYSLSTKTASRTVKNEHLYNTIDDINVDYIDIDDAKEIELNAINDNITSREDYRRRKGFDSLLKEEKPLSITEEVIEPETTNKVYDINDLLKKAKENKLFEEDNKKRYINTEYNILTKLDLEHIEEEKEEMKKENLKNLIDTIYSNTLATDLKKGVTDKPLLDDLMKTKVELEPEISKEILDPDATTKVVASKEDKQEENEQLVDLINKTFIGTNELIKRENKSKEEDTNLTMTKTEDFTDIDSKDSKLTVIIVVVAVLAVLAVVGVVLAKKLGAF